MSKKKKHKKEIRADTNRKEFKKNKNKKKKKEKIYSSYIQDNDYVSEYGLHTYKSERGRDSETRANGDNLENLVDNSVLLQALLDKKVVTRQMATQIPTVKACIDKIASTIASVPICLYRRNEDGTPVKVVDDRRLFLLNHDTGDTLQSAQFMRAMIEDYYLGNNGGYAFIAREHGVGIKSLHYIPAIDLNIVDNNDPIYKDFNIWIRGKSYMPYDFFKIMRNTTDGIRNHTIIDDNPLLISLCYASLQYEDSLVRKGGNKKGFLLAERPLKTEAQQELRENFRNLYNNNTENVVVLNNGLKFQESSNTSVELQLNENKESNGKEICKLFGVPPTILYGGATDKDWEIFLHTCMSVIFDIEKSLDRDLLMESEKENNYYFAYDTNELTRGNIKERYEAYQTALKNSFLRIDEVREKEGLQPIGFDFVQLGLDSVLYNPENGTVYTPNTNAITKMDEGTLVNREVNT